MSVSRIPNPSVDVGPVPDTDDDFGADLARLLREGLVRLDVDETTDDLHFPVTPRGVAYLRSTDEPAALAALDPVEGRVTEVHARTTVLSQMYFRGHSLS